MRKLFRMCFACVCLASGFVESFARLARFSRKASSYMAKKKFANREAQYVPMGVPMTCRNSWSANCTYILSSKLPKELSYCL